MKKGKVYVPKDEELRAEVIQLHHDDVLAIGQWGMMEDSGVGNKELLIARSYKGCGKICRRV